MCCLSSGISCPSSFLKTCMRFCLSLPGLCDQVARINYILTLLSMPEPQQAFYEEAALRFIYAL